MRITNVYECMQCVNVKLTGILNNKESINKVNAKEQVDFLRVKWNDEVGLVIVNVLEKAIEKDDKVALKNAIDFAMEKLNFCRQYLGG